MFSSREALPAEAFKWKDHREPHAVPDSFVPTCTGLLALICRKVVPFTFFVYNVHKEYIGNNEMETMKRIIFSALFS
jgi:hypothetical protein